MKLSLHSLEILNTPDSISVELLSEWANYYRRKNGRPHEAILLDAPNSQFIVAKSQVSSFTESRVEDVGFLQFEIEKTAGHIHLVFIAKTTRGLGIGSKLVSACLDFMKTKDLKKVHTEILPANLPSISLFNGFGFKNACGFQYEKKI